MKQKQNRKKRQRQQQVQIEIEYIETVDKHYNITQEQYDQLKKKATENNPLKVLKNHINGNLMVFSDAFTKEDIIKFINS